MADANSDIIFTIKDIILYVKIVTLSAKDSKNISKLLSKGFERSYWNELKQKMRIKMQQTRLDIFLNQTL